MVYYPHNPPLDLQGNIEQKYVSQALYLYKFTLSLGTGNSNVLQQQKWHILVKQNSLMKRDVPVIRDKR